MPLVLGIDIGPTSIGWALVDDEGGTIRGCGVRVFPEGVDRDTKGGEKSKNQSRREARAARRLIKRRAGRKHQLVKLLRQAGLLPVDLREYDRLLEANPYALRRRALAEPLSPPEIGRILVHLNQRRGFKSNRKTDKSSDGELKGMKREMSELDTNIREAGSRTLGAYLAKIADTFDHTRVDPTKAIRGRHTRRDMYEHEFNEIWNAQAQHHPSLLTNSLRQRVFDCIFHQRNVYWPRSVIGRCELEPREKRCPRAARCAQRFRLLQEVNNLRLIDRSTGEVRALSEDERIALIEYLSRGKARSWDQIRKKLGFSEQVVFNFEQSDRKKIKGHVTDALLASKKGVGKRWWKVPDHTRDEIVDILLGDLPEDDAMRRLTESCGLSGEEAEKALSVDLPDGFVSYSRVAITRLLPHLERGLPVMGNDETDSALHAAGYLRPDQQAVREHALLPPPPDLPNPIVRQAMFEVRRVVNAIVREFGRPDLIRVELAREAKRSFEQRERLRKEQTQRRDERHKAATRIENEVGVKATRGQVNRFILWQEQDGSCMYCGHKIGLAQLFGGEVDIDHILPRWRSLDDSMANKVVCHRACNAEKGDKTPREWLEHAHPHRYAAMLQTIKVLPVNKQRKFLQREISLDDFVSRQLTDTAYISRLTSQYLRTLGAPVECTRGQLTAELRRRWGLDTILDPEGRGEKNRADHRHHAIDAVVTALMDRTRLHALANSRGDIGEPWPGFREDIRASILAVSVSHRVRRKIRGALHEDFFYGATQKKSASDRKAPGGVHRRWAKGWIEDEETLVRRKPVKEITSSKHLEKVRDAAIRECLKKHLKDLGIDDPDRTGTLPRGVFEGENTPRMPSGVPIRRVRMFERGTTYRKVSKRRSYQYVKPGSNHHVVIRAAERNGRESWEAEVVTMMDAAKRAISGEPIIDRSDQPGRRFIMSLSIGEMFQIEGEDGERHLCVVRKIDQRSGRLHYKLHADARDAAKINKDNLYMSPSALRDRNASKVTVDPIGRIRRASD